MINLSNIHNLAQELCGTLKQSQLPTIYMISSTSDSFRIDRYRVAEVVYQRTGVELTLVDEDRWHYRITPSDWGSLFMTLEEAKEYCSKMNTL